MFVFLDTKVYFVAVKQDFGNIFQQSLITLNCRLEHLNKTAITEL